MMKIWKSRVTYGKRLVITWQSYTPSPRYFPFRSMGACVTQIITFFEIMMIFLDIIVWVSDHMRILHVLRNISAKFLRFFFVCEFQKWPKEEKLSLIIIKSPCPIIITMIIIMWCVLKTKLKNKSLIYVLLYLGIFLAWGWQCYNIYRSH